MRMEPALGGQTFVPFNLGLQLFSENQQSLTHLESSLKVSQQLSSTNRMVEPSSKIQIAVPVTMGSQPLSTTGPSGQGMPLQTPKVSSSMIGNLGAYQLSTSNQPAQMLTPKVQTSMSSSIGSLQMSTTKKRSAQMGPFPKGQKMMFPNSGRDQLQSTNMLTNSGKEQLQSPNMIINSGRQQLPEANKRTKVEQLPWVHFAMPISQIPQPPTLTNKPAVMTESLPKAQTESFETVRSKLRESLAASLALVSEEQSKSETAGKSSPVETATAGKSNPVQTAKASSTSKEADTSALPGESTSEVANVPSCDETENKCDVAQICDGGQSLSGDTLMSESPSECMQKSQSKHNSLETGVPCSSNVIIQDDLLQENGLCWASDPHFEGTVTNDAGDFKKPRLAHKKDAGDLKEQPCNSPQTLAVKIEAELFRLFGGVNKKYREKGRSLLFNLKDPKNPELRERVVSGEITPERLCSMTAEDLASKELSEWRIAKAEEFAQMVVLPDSEVDLRRLVKKNHKGEFQVEVDQDDGFPIGVSAGADTFPRVPRKEGKTEAQTKSKTYNKDAAGPSKPNETEPSGEFALPEKVDSTDQNLLNNLTPLPHEKTDFMQDLMVDELKDAGSLPPIVSLDEFMEALDSEPPFENLTVNSLQEMQTANEKGSDNPVSEVGNVAISSETGSDPTSDSFVLKPDSASERGGLKVDRTPDHLGSKVDRTPDHLGSKVDRTPDHLGSKVDRTPDHLGSKVDHADSCSTDSVDTATANPCKIDVKNTDGECNLKAAALHVESVTCLPDVASKGESVWEGLIQLSVSSLATIIGFYRSGEKTSTKEWPSCLEVKGRVRLDAFEKFLQEIPLSRTRAIMVVEFNWKEDSPDSGRFNLCETIESYVTDERVGFAEPCPGVELYLCPPHIKTTEMLGKQLGKEHLEALASTDNSLVGIVVWRKFLVTSNMSPRLSTSHKHNGSKKQAISRKIGSNLNSTLKPSMAGPSNPEEPLDDVPPGFGPSSTRDDDDLPEFDFVRGSKSSPKVSSGASLPHHVPPPPSRPVHQMRELIQKYGQGRSREAITTWNDDDDIPEWQPPQDNHPQPPKPTPQVHGLTQQTMQPQPVQMLLPNQPPLPPHQHFVSLAPQPFAVPLQPLMAPQLIPPPGWQAGMWWPTQGTADVGFPPSNGLVHPLNPGSSLYEGQFNGLPSFVSSQQGMDWRPDLSRSRGP